MGYENMTIDELIAENKKLTAQRDAIKEEQRKLYKILDKKLTIEGAKKKFETLSDTEKEAFKQIITEAGGIESEEKVKGLKV